MIHLLNLWAAGLIKPLPFDESNHIIHLILNLLGKTTP